MMRERFIWPAALGFSLLIFTLMRSPSPATADSQAACTAMGTVHVVHLRRTRRRFDKSPPSAMSITTDPPGFYPDQASAAPATTFIWSFIVLLLSGVPIFHTHRLGPLDAARHVSIARRS